MHTNHGAFWELFLSALLPFLLQVPNQRKKYAANQMYNYKALSVFADFDSFYSHIIW